MMPKTQKLAKEIGAKMTDENGIDNGVNVFHAHLPIHMRFLFDLFICLVYIIAFHYIHLTLFFTSLFSLSLSHHITLFFRCFSFHFVVFPLLIFLSSHLYSLSCDIDPHLAFSIYCFDCDLFLSIEAHSVLHQHKKDHRWFRASPCDWTPEIFLPGVHHVIAGVAGGITESLMVRVDEILSQLAHTSPLFFPFSYLFPLFSITFLSLHIYI
jgi:hypothetical protein